MAKFTDATPSLPSKTIQEKVQEISALLNSEKLLSWRAVGMITDSGDDITLVAKEGIRIRVFFYNKDVNIVCFYNNGTYDYRQKEIRGKVAYGERFGKPFADRFLAELESVLTLAQRYPCS